MFLTWLVTVFSDIPSRSAICAYVQPHASNRSTSISLEVSATASIRLLPRLRFLFDDRGMASRWLPFAPLVVEVLTDLPQPRLGSLQLMKIALSRVAHLERRELSFRLALDFQVQCHAPACGDRCGGRVHLYLPVVSVCLGDRDMAPMIQA